MPRVLRYLRIAFSVTCGLACVLLIVLWVRSYWWTEYFSLPLKSDGLLVHSRQGILYAITTTNQVNAGFRSTRVPPDLDWQDYISGRTTLGFGLVSQRGSFPLHLFVPYYAVVGLCLILAATPWLSPWSKRFSLRTLLIATTVVAVVLGLIVWAARAGQ